MRILKLFFKIFATFILLSFIFWTFLLGLLQTKQGQDWALSQLISYLENKTNSEIKVGEIHFSFPLNLSLQDVSISQDNQPVLLIQQIDLSCAYSHLFHGRLIFSEVHASDIILHRWFQNKTNSPFSNSSLSETFLIPIYVKLENINIENITLGSHITESLKLPSQINALFQTSSFHLQGMASHNPFRKSIVAHLHLSAQSDISDLTPFSLGIDTQNHQLSFSFHSYELPIDLFEANFPSSLKAHSAIYASAPFTTWQNLFLNSLFDNAIEGNFKISLHSSVDDSQFSHLVDQTSLRSSYLLKSLKEIELVDLKLENPNFSLEGGAVINSDKIIEHGDFKGEIFNLNYLQTFLDKEVDGRLAFEGHATGHYLSPTLFIHVQSPQLSVSNILLEHLNATMKATFQNNGSNGILTCHFQHQKFPFKIKTFYDFNEKKLTLNHLEADISHTYVKGDVTCSASDYLLEGFLQARTNKLEEFSHVSLIPVYGEGELNIKMAGIGDGFHAKKQQIQANFVGKNISIKEYQADQIVFNLTANSLQEGKNTFHIQSKIEGKNLNWLDYSIDHVEMQLANQIDLKCQKLNELSIQWNAQEIKWSKGQIKNAEGNSLLNNPFDALEGNIQMTFHNSCISQTEIEELSCQSTVNSSDTQWPFFFKGKGFAKDDFVFNGGGIWHFHNNHLIVRSNQFNGTFGPYPFHLNCPLNFELLPNKIRLTNLHFQWGEGEIQAAFNQDDETSVFQFKTNGIPSELFHYVAPELPFAGRISFQGSFEGSTQDPKGHLKINLNNIQMIEDIFVQKPFIEGQIDVDLHKNGMQFKSQLAGIGNSPLLISGHLPLNHFQIDFESPFALSLNAEGELASYLHLFYDDATHLSGQTKVALQMSGKINSPQVQGTVHLTNGSFESLTGAQYHNIQGQLEGNGSKVFLTQFSAKDNKSGEITANGEITLDSSHHFPFDFKIYPSKIFISNSDYLALSVSGPLNLIGNFKQSKLKGELTVDEATFHLEESLPRQIKTVDVKYTNSSKEDDPSSLLEKKDKQAKTELDIKLQAPKNVMIEGRHLKSEWKGEIHVTGTFDQPLLHGELRVTKGEYDFNGKIFQLSQGNIHFAGQPDKKTTLYVVANKEFDRITAEIIVKGAVNKPVISFRSNPPLSQRDVLSYILFNRGISDISSDQGDQLTQSFISLNTNEQNKASDDFLSRLRNNMGIDRLDFTANDKENKDIALQIGKNITENISVSVNQGMKSVAPVIALEAKLRKNFKVQAEASVDDEAPVRMSLKWKKDY